MKNISVLMLVLVFTAGLGTARSFAVVPPDAEGFTQNEKAELARRLAGIEARLDSVEKDLRSAMAMIQGE